MIERAIIDPSQSIDCEHLKDPRHYAICRGEVFGEQKTNQYRASETFGRLGPLKRTPSSVTPTHNARQPRTDQKRERIPRPPIPETGPGTEFKKLAKTLIGEDGGNCGACVETMNRMNAMGVAGCRENRTALIAEIKTRSIGIGLTTQLKAGWNGLIHGIIVNPLDPIPGLFDLAVRKADENPTPPVAPPATPRPPAAKWSYGVMTTPARRTTFLPATLASLKAAGFDKPVLFIDGGDSSGYAEFGLTTICRSTAIGNFANWFASALELYLRDPHADFYALFEDDILISRGAREYVEATAPAIKDAYFNLYTSPVNERLGAPQQDGWFRTVCRDRQGRVVELESLDQLRNETCYQAGLGACGLVFPRDIFRSLLHSQGMLDHPTDPRPGRGKAFSDGMVVTAMNRLGIAEHCHLPSIILHAGDGHSTLGHGSYGKSRTFRGAEFDLMGLVK